MSNQVVEMNLPNGSTVLARVAAVDGGGAEKASVGIPNFDFDDVGESVQGLAEVLKAALVKVAPDKVSVELGLELAVKSGKLTGLIVEGEGKGSLAVTIEWAGGDPGG